MCLIYALTRCVVVTALMLCWFHLAGSVRADDPPPPPTHAALLKKIADLEAQNKALTAQLATLQTPPQPMPQPTAPQAVYYSAAVGGCASASASVDACGNTTASATSGKRVRFHLLGCPHRR